MSDDGIDGVEIKRFGFREPVRRVPATSAFWYSLSVFRQRRGIPDNEPLPPGVYVLDHGDGALTVEVDSQGQLTFGFDGACPPTAEWAGTPSSDEPSGSG